MKLRPAVWLLLLAVLGVLVVAWMKRKQAADHETRLRLEAETGAIPLFIEAPKVTLFNRAEEAVPLESYRGRMVFVNFWATWCGPCVAEMPSLIALQASLDPDDIAFVSISEDDTWPPVDGYTRKNPMPFDLYRDRPPRVEIPFAAKSYPTSYLIDREGQALYRFNGGRNWDTQAIRDLLALDGVRAR